MSDSEQTNPTTGRSLQKPSDAPDEVAFVERLKRGDEQAWIEFVEQYSTRLYNHLRQQLPTHDVTNDVMSETIMALVRAIPQFDHRVALSTFVFSLAQHKLADYWRRPPQTEWDIVPTTILPDLLDGLPEEWRHVLLLRYHSGHSIDEIAEILGKTYKGTESMLQRARAGLRELMDAGGIPEVKNAPDLMRPLFLPSVLQILSTQQQKCLDAQMSNEAAIFERARRFLQRLMREQPVREAA